MHYAWGADASAEKKPSGKLQVDPAIAEQYKAGGEQREVLEMALLESLAKFGIQRASYKRIKAMWWFVYGGWKDHSI